MRFRHALRKLLWKTGYDIWPFRPDIHPLARRRRLLEKYGIDTVLDVGANEGQYARELRSDLGFGGHIISFEPLASAFTSLERYAATDPRWTAINCALGDADGPATINVSGNSFSSSILPMLPAHVRSAPDSGFTGTESIRIMRLDSIFDTVCGPDATCYLKIDVQGFEGRVLVGAQASLRRIHTIQLEMSLTPMYGGELAFGEMHGMLLDKGFQLVSIEPGFADQATGQLLQVDGIYHRVASARS